MKDIKYTIEPIMGMGREYGYYLWRQEEGFKDEKIGRFNKRKWANEMLKHLKQPVKALNY
jgi:hypothetical protein|tara:strand:- start:209 stop:388 length:180 start_codon:yes stop_codon:yes gene_type:complete